MRKIRKDEMEEFERLTTNLLKNYCKGRQDEFMLFDYPSKGGELKIKVDLTLPSSVYSVFCRFTDYRTSKQVYPWLSGTGKYNFHTTASSGQEAFNQLKNHLTPVL